MKYINPDMFKLTIHATYRCNGACDNCCNLIYQAPSNEEMPTELLEKLVEDSVALNYKWRDFHLQGGEPTLHRDFKNQCLILEKYKLNHNPSINLALITNGYSDYTKEMIRFALQHNFTIGDSKKSKDIMEKTSKYDYVPVNIAPIDVGYKLETLGCWLASDCGIAFNNRGFWECQAAASASRVFDFYEPISKELKDVTLEKAQKKFEEHCKYCGFALPIPRIKDQQSSNIWQEAFDKYNKKEK